MKTVEKEKLWEEYQKNPSAELREKCSACTGCGRAA